jgi:hypothetical protein
VGRSFIFEFQVPVRCQHSCRSPSARMNFDTCPLLFPCFAPFAKELARFSWWFTADKFGDAWSLGMLLKVLRLTKEIEGGMAVVKLLAELAVQYPLECVAYLDLMVQGDRDNWVLVGVEVETRRAIKAALDRGQHDTVVDARRLVELLIARVQYGFRNLLSEPTSITGT